MIICMVHISPKNHIISLLSKKPKKLKPTKVFQIQQLPSILNNNETLY